MVLLRLSWTRREVVAVAMRMVIEREGKLYEFKSCEVICRDCKPGCSVVNHSAVTHRLSTSLCNILAVSLGFSPPYRWEEVS